MKFTAAQKKSLATLLKKLGDGKETEKLTKAEQAEIKTLKEAATAVGFDYTVEDKTPDEDFVAKAVSDDDLKKMLGDVLKDSGLDAEKLFKAIKDSGSEITAASIGAQIKSAFADHAANGSKAVEAAVTAALQKQKAAEPAPAAPITLDMVKAMMTEVVKAMPGKSRMEHEDGDKHVIEFPIAHRLGNLSVAEKQMLNICMGFTEGMPEKKRLEIMNEGITPSQLEIASTRGNAHMKALRRTAGRKTLTTTGSGSGLELMPFDLATELQLRLYMESLLAQAFQSQEIEMPSDPFRLPLLTTRTQFGVGAQGVAAPESSPGTANPTLTTGKLIGMANYSYEAEEDAIVAVLPMLMAQMALAAADALEDAIINGDTAGTHQDSDTAATNANAAPAKLFNGLRKLALAGTTATSTSLASGGITALNIAAVRKLLKKYGMKPKDLLLICGTNGYNDIVTLAETMTAEKTGNAQMARIIGGDAPSVYGIPVIPSAHCREDLNAAGVFDNVTANNGTFLIVHKPSWIMGVKRQFMVEVWNNKPIQANQVIASFRRAFIPLETPSATVPNVALAFGYKS